MDDVTLSNIRGRFAELPPGTVIDGHIWDVRDHGMALLDEIQRLRELLDVENHLHSQGNALTN